MNIFDIEEINLKLLSFLDLEQLVSVRCVNKDWAKRCDMLILEMTQERKKSISTSICNNSFSTINNKNFINCIKHINSLFQENKNDKTLDILELIFYKILDKKISNVYHNKESFYLFRIWERIVPYISGQQNYYWKLGDPFYFQKPCLNTHLFNINSIPLIMKNFRNNINPWKRQIFLN